MVKRGMNLMTLPYIMLTTPLDSPIVMTVNPNWYVPKHSEIYIWEEGRRRGGGGGGGGKERGGRIY